MGVYSGRGANVNPYAMSLEMRAVVRPWQTAYILILDPGVNNVNFVNKLSAAFKWHGFARVQPYRREIAVAAPTNPTTTQTVRFQVDFSEDGQIPFLKTGYQIIVVPPELIASALVPGADLLPSEDLLPALFDEFPELEYADPHMTEYVHVVQSSMNSSLAWIRTIETTVNTEVRNTFQIDSDGSGGFQWIS